MPGTRRPEPTLRTVRTTALSALPHAFLACTLALTPASTLGAVGTAPQGLPSFAEPGISPDASEIAFVSGGDIWTTSSAGGAARLLVAHSANDSRPMYSPDGSKLAFNSDRDGGLNIYLMDLRTGVVARLTHASGQEQLNGWSRDSEWVYFSSTDEDIGSKPTQLPASSVKAKPATPVDTPH